ncbi:MAG: NnrU family protein [Jannaschia sp.]
MSDLVGWVGFAASFAVFLLLHLVPLRPRVRGRLVSAIGVRGFGLTYAAVSLGTLFWLIAAAGRAPYVPLWHHAGWLVWIPLLAMLPACLILSLTLGRANSFSFGGPADGFDPSRPGIVRVMRHPVLWALALWAASHMVANGDLAHVTLFGLFTGFAIAGRGIIDRRRRRLMGPEWDRLARAVRTAPICAPASWRGAALRLLFGALGWAALIVLHPLLMGVSPLPL